MIKERDYFLSQDGLKINYRYWEGDTPPRAVLCIVHGLAEHSGRYAHVAMDLIGSDIAVFAMDLRGHGLSQGKHGHARSLSILLSDIEELLKTARAAHTELPMYLMGHSLGGNLVANYVIKMNTNELEGYILSAPWFKLAFEPPPWKLKLGKIIGGIFPSFTQSNELDPNHLSKDPQVIENYKNDPKIHNVISVGLYLEIMRSAEYAHLNAGKIELKGLIYHGSDDQITDWLSTKEFAERTPLAEWHKLEGVYHEPHNDIEKEEVIAMVMNWILSPRAI